LHNLLHFLAIRIDGHAQTEIREYAIAMGRLMQPIVPLVWDAFEDYRLSAMYLSGLEVRVITTMLMNGFHRTFATALAVSAQRPSQSCPITGDRTAELHLEAEACDRGCKETIDLAMKAFELSQDHEPNGLQRTSAAKRRILEIICLNWTRDGVTLVPEMRKPFDLLAEAPKKNDSWGDRI
jgi:hypothetical protein